MKTTSKTMLLFLLLMDWTPQIMKRVIDRNSETQFLNLGMSQKSAHTNFSETQFMNIDMNQKSVNNKMINKTFIDDQSNTVMLIKLNVTINNGKHTKSTISPKTRDPSIHPELASGYGRSGA